MKSKAFLRKAIRHRNLCQAIPGNQFAGTTITKTMGFGCHIYLLTLKKNIFLVLFQFSSAKPLQISVTASPEDLTRGLFCLRGYHLSLTEKDGSVVLPVVQQCSVNSKHLGTETMQNDVKRKTHQTSISIFSTYIYIFLFKNVTLLHH